MRHILGTVVAAATAVTIAVGAAPALAASGHHAVSALGTQTSTIQGGAPLCCHI